MLGSSKLDKKWEVSTDGVLWAHNEKCEVHVGGIEE